MFQSSNSITCTITIHEHVATPMIVLNYTPKKYIKSNLYNCDAYGSISSHDGNKFIKPKKNNYMQTETHLSLPTLNNTSSKLNNNNININVSNLSNATLGGNLSLNVINVSNLSNAI